jgi:PAS domain S-box-containing protein
MHLEPSSRLSPANAAELLSTALENAVDGQTVLDVASMACIYVNEAAAGLFGRTRDELLQCGPQLMADMGGEPVEALRRSCRQWIEQAPEAFAFERQYRLPDGAPRWIRTTGRAVQTGGRWVICASHRQVDESRRMEHALKLLTAAIDQAADAIFVIDPETYSYVHINDAAARIYGFQRDEMMALGVMEVSKRLDLVPAAEVAALYRELIEQHPRSITGVFHFTPPGGSPTIVESRRQAVNVDGKWLIVTIARDVTQQHAERQQLELLAKAMDEAGDAIFVIDPEAYKYVAVNQAAAALYGLPRQEMIDRGMDWANAAMKGLRSREELLPLHYEAIKRYPEALRETREFPRPGGGPPRILETTRRAMQVDGKWLVVSVRRDVTELQLSLRQLQQLHEALNDAHDPVYVIDPEAMEWVYINKSATRVFGMPVADLMKLGMRKAMETIGIWSLDELHALYLSLIERYPEAATDTRTVAWPGRPEVVLEYTRRAVRVGNDWRIVTVTHDVTDRVRAAAQLEARAAELARSNRDLEQFAYVTSHDLSEPLRMVASYTQLLERRYGHLLDKDGKEFMHYIVDGAQRMRQLIDDLLVYSRAGRGDSKLQEHPLDVPLDRALANLEHAVRDAGATIERPASLPVVPCNPTAMTQLFQNLVGNALKFRGERPMVVRITAEREGPMWRISVADTGIGIAPEYFERVFVIFQRLHTRDRYEGTGIGLAICKKVVERHGGRIWVESTPGEGACFRFTLPAEASQ